MTSTIRVTIRGTFVDLTDDQRAELLAAQAEHDFMHTVYTREGYLTYDIAARPFFAFRFVTEGEDVSAAETQAELDTMERLEALGYGFKDLKVQGVDMSKVPLGARCRRAASGSVPGSSR
jgi:hypothetical protein